MKNARKWGVNPNLNPDFPAVDEEHECHIAKQYLEMLGADGSELCFQYLRYLYLQLCFMKQR